MKIGKNTKRKKLTSFPLTIISQGRLLFSFGEGKHPKSCEYLVTKVFEDVAASGFAAWKVKRSRHGLDPQSSPNFCHGKIPPTRIPKQQKAPINLQAQKS